MKRASKAPAPLEHQEQAQLAAWLDFIGVLWCHVPNSSRAPVQYRAKMAKLGLKAGVPDILIFTPPPAIPGTPGCAIELKRIRGGVVSRDQQVWLSALHVQGWQTLVARGAADAIQWLDETMGYRPCGR